jgi:hypothetical protein
MAIQVYESQLLENDQNNFYGANWRAQTFQALEAHTIYSVKLILVRKIGSPGDAIVGIRDGGPTGPEVALSSYNVNGLPVNVQTLIEFVLSANPVIIVGQTYAIVLRLPGGTGSKYCTVLRKDANPYPRGSYQVSSNSGASWTATSFDMYFEELGEPIPPISGLNPSMMELI